MKEKSSARFRPSLLTEKLVPILLAVILFGLLAVLAITLLALLGFIPGA